MRAETMSNIVSHWKKSPSRRFGIPRLRDLGVSASLAALFTLAFAVPVGSAYADTPPIQDTTISEHPNLGDADGLNGDRLVLYAIRGAGGFLSYPVVQFDLSSFAGADVMGPGTLDLFVMGNDSFRQYSRPVSVHEVLVPWDSATATFNNFGATPGVQWGTDVGASYLDLRYVDYPSPWNRYVSWTIPESMLQEWIDDPDGNHGVLLYNWISWNQFDLFFDSMEGGNPPKLSFDVDSDRDGLSDDDELALAGSSDCPDPLNVDSDGDSLSDGVEILTIGTDPCNPDSDGDAVDDGADECPMSDLTPTVLVDGQDTGVANDLLGNGCSLADLMSAALAGELSTADSVRMLVDLKLQGILSGPELGAMLRALNGP